MNDAQAASGRSLHLDARALAPPEPFVRTLEMLSGMKAGDRLHLTLRREPFPLYQFLQENGIAWDTCAMPYGEFEIIITA